MDNVTIFDFMLMDKSFKLSQSYASSLELTDYERNQTYTIIGLNYENFLICMGEDGKKWYWSFHSMIDTSYF